MPAADVRDTDAAAWEDAWQPVVDVVGTDFSDGEVIVAPDAVEAGAVRKFCEPLEFDCPLHHEVDTARAFGYADIVAPVSSLVSFALQPLWRPGESPAFVSAEADAQPTRTSVGPKTTGLEPATPAFFATDMAADFLAPVVAGDRLSRAGNRLVACVPKETRLGRGAFMTWESEVRNQRECVVATLRNTVYRYQPHTGKERVPTPAASTSTCAEDGRVFPPVSPTDWSSSRSWDDVVVGDEVGPVAYPLSIYRLVVAAGATRDFNSIHHNRDFARATGAPDMYANVIFLQGMWERCAREFIGLGGTIRSIAGFRMGSFNTVGDVVVVRGSVRDKRLDETGRGVLELEMVSENREGVSVGPGLVTVTVPRS